MANVKDLLVNGSARVIGTIYGNATSANKLNTNAGSSSQPVYFSNGIPVAITSSISNNAASATKLLNARNFKIGSTSKSFNGTADVTWTHAEIGATVSNTWTGGTTAGPTLSTTVNGITGTAVAIPSASASASGVITTGNQSFAGVKTFTNKVVLKDGNQMGAQIGAAYITTSNSSTGAIILQNGHLRFGGPDWDYNKWAGLKYDYTNKHIFLGLADGSIFAANSTQSDGTFKLLGISTIDANKTASIKNLAIGGGIYWDPYVESVSDSSDAASITVLKSGVAGGTELRISQANDGNDIINLVSPAYIYFNSKQAFQINDNWLRINPAGSFSSGTYFNRIVRTDGELLVRDIGLYNANQTKTGRLYNGATGTAGNGTNLGGIGTAILELGNSTAVSDAANTGANNAQGFLRLYGSGTGYGQWSFDNTYLRPSHDIHFTNNSSATSGWANGIHGLVGSNDFWRVGGGATDSNAGYMEIATADDANEPIYVRQYYGTFDTLNTTLTLLDASHNTIIPNALTVGTTISQGGSYKFYVNGTSYLNGDISGVSNIYPLTNNSKNLGSSSLKWANAYATTFHGALDGNASTATSAQALTRYTSISGQTVAQAKAQLRDKFQEVGNKVGVILVPGAFVEQWGDDSKEYYNYHMNSFISLNPSYDNYTYGHFLVAQYGDNDLRHVGLGNGNWSAMRTLLDSSNYTSYTVTKTGTGASGTWGINISGNANSASKVNNKLTVGNKTYDGSAAVTIAASDLGLSSAMLFLGTTTTAITDGAKTNPVAIGGSNKTVTAGNVVLYGSKEFVWTGSAWEELGNEGSYKIVQAAVGDPSASGTSNTFIATISQDANGKITATKKTVAVTNSAPTLSWGATSTIGTVAGTNLQVKMPANPNTWRGIQNNLTSDSTTDSLAAAQGKALKALIDGKAASNHTHNYAGSSSAGGSANSAVKLDTATAGDSNTPVYFANGKPVACSYKLEGNIHSYKGSLASGGWKKLSNRSVIGPYLSIAYNKDPASWNSGTYSASLVFGNEDTRGLLDCSYNIPVVTFGGAYHDGSTDDNPNWYFKLQGNTKQTYTFPTRSKTLCATDGSNASGTWGISITGSSASCTGNAVTATKLSTARTITLSGAVTGSASFDGSKNITISTTSSQQTLPYSSSTSQLFVTSTANQASYTLSNFVDNAVYHVYVNGFKIPNSEYTVSSSGVVTLTNPPELANQEVEIVANYTSYVTTDSSIHNSSYLNYYRQATAPSNTNALWLDTSTTTSSSSFTPKLYDGGKWNAIGGADTAVLDARYVLKSGDTMTGTLTTPNLFVINDTCNTTYDAVAYFRHYSNNDWCVKIDTGSFNYGLNVITNESSAYGIVCNSRITGNKVYGAVWNDYAEYRKSDVTEPGRVVIENGDGTLSLSTKRLQRGAEVISDTYGFAIGETDECKTPIAATGRVLAYTYEPIEEYRFKTGWPVCSGPNGTVSIMTEKEEEKYPSRIIGTISEVPDYEEWGTGKVKTNGRVWIRIK